MPQQVPTWLRMGLDRRVATLPPWPCRVLATRPGDPADSRWASCVPGAGPCACSARSCVRPQFRAPAPGH
eukprot:8851358-Alexandrium_andersonii.AAC.1